MLTALAVPAMVEMNADGDSTWPTNSGKVYTSEGCKDLVLVIRLSLLAVPAAVTKFTLIVAALPL
jgi:hypothetical protein